MTIPRYGIMADSHGRADRIGSAIDFLEQNGCTVLVHLGDVCDSAHAETADACIQPLVRRQVLTLKGNNDHTVVANHQTRPGAVLSAESLEFLAGLPLVRQLDGAWFTHSLPFDKAMGLSALIGTMGPPQARAFFQEHPRGLLFRGHSHAPTLMRQTDGQIGKQDIPLDTEVKLADRLPAIVTCGALTRRLCMIWDPAENTILSCRL